MIEPAILSAIETSLGYVFRDISHLIEALTHSTFANEHPGSGPANERMEFLGDAVLDLLAAHLLFTEFGSAHEGELTRRRARVVCTDTLAQIADQLGLPRYLRLGQGQVKDGAPLSRRTLAGAYEALAAAVYLDGSMSEVERCFGPVLKTAIDKTRHPSDFKTLLQELCHERGAGSPHYSVVQVDGPPHARVYTCEVIVKGEPRGRGVAGSKKAAEQICAKAALAELAEK